jgi:hypothetical protein
MSALATPIQRCACILIKIGATEEIVAARTPAPVFPLGIAEGVVCLQWEGRQPAAILYLVVGH